MRDRPSTRRPRLALAALACAAVAVWPAGCSEDGSSGDPACEAQGAVDTRADLQVSDSVGPVKAAYTFDAQNLPGGHKTLTFKVRNTANLLSARPLTITAIALSETNALGKSDGKQTFSCVGPGGQSCDKAAFSPVVPEGWLAQAKCPPAGAQTSESFEVQYVHDSGAGARRLKIALRTSGDPNWQDKALEIQIDTSLGSPRLQCPKNLVEFGLLKAGESKTEKLKCVNTGSATLVIDKVELLSNTDPPLTVSFAGVAATVAKPYEGPPAVEVAASASIDFSFALDKVPDAKKLGATVKIHSNDPNESVKSLLVQANSSGPCYTINPVPVDFGKVPVGQTVPRELQLAPCGTETVPLTSIGLSKSTSQDFSLDFSTASFPAEQHKTGPTAAAPLHIVPGGVAQTLRARCHPQQASDKPLQGAVQFTDDKGETREVGLLCESFETAKPIACIQIFAEGAEVAVGATVIPQTPLALKSGCSTAPAGQSLAKFEWKVQQPTGSVGLLSPSPLAAAPAFTPNVAGSYQFCLTVSDNAGAPSEQVCRDLQVVPDNKLHLELTWTQAGDADKSDAKGADLDLHLAHPLAPKVHSKDLISGALSKQPDADGNGVPDPWFAQCYDCFWLNCKGTSPNWPAEGEPKDDPRVDLDDTDGWGPENLSIETPQENEWYHIGVYAWDDAGLGPSVPTVRVYLDKKLVKEIKGPAMVSDDMWCVGKVLWNPSSPNPVADVADCEGASPGKPLLTKKYPNPAKDPTSFNFKCAPVVGP